MTTTNKPDTPTTVPLDGRVVPLAPKRCTAGTPCRPDAKRDKVSDGVYSMTLKCRECGEYLRFDWD